MSYGADFATADPANAPLDPPIFIGADPALWGALILLLAAAALLGWWLGARSVAKHPDAARGIWEAIDEAAKDAMKADDNALKGRAEHLLKVVDKRLGRTLKLAKGLSKNVGRLQKAVDGKAEEAHGGGHGGGHGAGHGGGQGHGGHGHGGHGGHEAHAERVLEPAGASAASAASSVTVITVGPAAVHPPAEPVHAAHDHHAEPRDMTQREQTDALRLAVAAFNQHWREESERIAELRAAHAELSGGR